jgi:hypothetical protein
MNAEEDMGGEGEPMYCLYLCGMRRGKKGVSDGRLLWGSHAMNHRWSRAQALSR